ncbi:hypothetical protein R1flu_022519 [Riccia fluitans]|uniref:Uncharacterized protein n=1 Tax=Riccia fluitans TaxID=41844 RepID=A0ABD1XPH3_9MARC
MWSPELTPYQNSLSPAEQFGGGYNLAEAENLDLRYFGYDRSNLEGNTQGAYGYGLRRTRPPNRRNHAGSEPSLPATWLLPLRTRFTREFSTDGTAKFA